VIHKLIALVVIIITFSGASGNEQDITSRKFNETIDPNKALEMISNGIPISHSLINGSLDLNELSKDKNIIIELSQIDGNVNISHIDLKSQTSFKGTTFNGTATFSGDQFEDVASFGDTVFNGDANFYDLDFDKSAQFGYSTFSGNATFSNISFRGPANFLNANFTKNASFTNIMASKYLNFEKTIFNGDVTFTKLSVEEDTSFSNSVFHFARFLGACLNGDADFRGTNFSSGASFNQSKFNGTAKFLGSNFSNQSFFEGAEFLDEANFNEAQFQGNSIFKSAKFKDNVNFIGARFGNPIYETMADFSDAEFGERITMSNIFFYKTPKITSEFLLTNAKFSQLVVEWNSIKDNLKYDGPTYLALIKNFRELEQFEDSDNCYYEYRDIKQKDPARDGVLRFFDLISLLCCGYGVRLANTVISSIVLMFIFAVYFWFFERRIVDAISFSVMIFLQTPRSEKYSTMLDNYKYAVIAEQMLGWSMMAVFIVVLTRKLIIS